MPIFFWKQNKKIDQFATQLADELFSMVPPEMAADLMLDANEAGGKKGKAKSGGKKYKRQGAGAAKMDALMNEIISKIIEFRTRLKLGVYGKARLHMQFRARLLELGYDERLSKSINEEIMLRTP